MCSYLTIKHDKTISKCYQCAVVFRSTENEWENRSQTQTPLSTLAYAVLMLNTDQHNTNAKKQNIPMTSEGNVTSLETKHSHDQRG